MLLINDNIFLYNGHGFVHKYSQIRPIVNQREVLVGLRRSSVN